MHWFVDRLTDKQHLPTFLLIAPFQSKITMHSEDIFNLSSLPSEKGLMVLLALKATLLIFFQMLEINNDRYNLLLYFLLDFGVVGKQIRYCFGSSQSFNVLMPQINIHWSDWPGQCMSQTVNWSLSLACAHPMQLYESETIEIETPPNQLPKWGAVLFGTLCGLQENLSGKFVVFRNPPPPSQLILLG